MPIFNNYLKLKDALVGDDFEAASKASAELQNSLNALENANFQDLAGEALESYTSRLETYLNSMTEAADIAALRDEFDEVSQVMIRMAQSFKPFGERLFIQHCPMANQDRGADWLSLSEEIRNPYYGSMMLKCGEVTGTVE
ncbi:DUF3347 domain-containing protein [Salegentibacter sp. HM20]